MALLFIHIGTMTGIKTATWTFHQKLLGQMMDTEEQCDQLHTAYGRLQSHGESMES